MRDRGFYITLGSTKYECDNKLYNQIEVVETCKFLFSGKKLGVS